MKGFICMRSLTVLLPPLFLFTGLLASGQTLPLSNLSQDDFNKVVDDFSANSLHTSVSGASSLGHLFGFEVGAVVGVTNTPTLNTLAKETSANAKAAQLPNAELIGALSVPFGLTAEIGLVPKVGPSSYSYQTMALAVKWTFTDMMELLPMSLAVKGSVSKTQFNFAQPINGVATTFKFDDTVTSLTVLASKDLVLLEPYAGIGLVSGSGNMNVSGSSQVYNFTSSGSASATRSSTVILAGFEVKLLLIKLGFEYSSLYGDSRYNGKISAFF